MRGKLLLFGFDSLLQILALESAVQPFGAELVPVGKSDYGKPLGVLAGLDDAGASSQPGAGGVLGGRMLVLCGLEDRVDELLPALSRAGAGPDCLKAVLTAHNRTWSGFKLYDELRKERRAMEEI